MYSTEQNITKDSQYFLYTPTALARKLFLYPTVIGRFEYMPSYSLTRSHYDSYLIILIESDSMEILLEESYQTARKGDVVIIDCYKPHAYKSDSGCKALWMHFDGAMAGSYFEYLLMGRNNDQLEDRILVSDSSNAISVPGSAIISMPNCSMVRRELLKLYDSFEKHELVSETSMSLIINNILLELMSFHDNTVTSVQDGIKKVTAYLSDNFSKDISLDQMAEIAGFSPYYFARRFKKETGVSPHQFLISTRILAAKYNLLNTSMTISEIAYACGFEDESAFCYCFRQREGITPNQLRKGSGYQKTSES